MPKIVDHDLFREEILRKSFPLFARKGYSKVTMRELAKHLDISSGTIYHYFKNKDDLFEEMVRLMAKEDVAQLDAMERMALQQNPEKVIEILFQFIYSKEAYFRSVILMVCDVIRFNEKGDKKINVLKDCLGIYRDAISKHVDLGNPELENLLLSIVIGTIFQRMLDPKTTTYGKTSDTLQKLYPFLTSGILFEVKKVGNA